MYNDNTNIYSLTNAGIFKMIGEYVKKTRLSKNWSQAELAERAGLNRSTISLFESGEKGNIETFVRLIRALDKLQIFEQFESRFNIDPLANIERENKERQRKQRTKKIK